MKDKKHSDFDMIFKLSEIDKVVKSIRDHCIHIWSVAVVNYIHAYDPEAVIIAGGFVNSKAIILPQIIKKLKNWHGQPWREATILSSELNSMVGVNGALFMAKQYDQIYEKRKTQL